jgi:hypothetical protein
MAGRKMESLSNAAIRSIFAVAAGMVAIGLIIAQIVAFGSNDYYETQLLVATLVTLVCLGLAGFLGLGNTLIFRVGGVISLAFALFLWVFVTLGALEVVDLVCDGAMWPLAIYAAVLTAIGLASLFFSSE